MGNKCIRAEENAPPKKQIKKDEFYAFSQLNSSNTKPMLQDQVCQINDFRLLKVLGRGGFSKVMLVQHINTQQLYAMKIIPKSILQGEKGRQSAKRERTLLEILDNEFIVKLHYAFQTKYKLYLVVDFMSGGELLEYVRHYKSLTEDVARFYGGQILLALEYLQENKVMYRDLKPENILLDKGYIKLADFGLSKVMDNEELTFSKCGTLEYLAPEVMKGQGYTVKCDCWSFGAVLYEMMVGTSLDTMQQVVYPDFLSQEAKEVISRLLEEDPKQRLSIKQAKEMKFFKAIDFEMLKRKEMEPPEGFLNQSKFKFFNQSVLQQTPTDTMIFDKVQNTISQYSYYGYNESQMQRSLTHYSSYGEPKSLLE